MNYTWCRNHQTPDTFDPEFKLDEENWIDTAELIGGYSRIVRRSAEYGLQLSGISSSFGFLQPDPELSHVDGTSLPIPNCTLTN